MRPISFRKMHGLGNDFVVLDAREVQIALAPADIRAIADRHTGIGCDQLILLEPANGAETFMRIYNPDGGEAGACGNATRCVATIVMDETGRSEAVVRTIAGDLPVWRDHDDQVTVDMGAARTDWNEIPLAQPADTLSVMLGPEAPGPAVCTSLGNPHATFFVEDADAIDLARIGPLLERHPMFPDRANIGVASWLGPGRLRLRVWERGAGLTLACGSGACAALVAASRRELVDRAAEIVMERGSLHITWREDGHVLMRGPAELSFTGTLPVRAA